jgi:hypothetical protein
MEAFVTVTVTATEFSRGFGRYQREAYVERVIRVVSHGTIIGGYLSAPELARYERLKEREREVFKAGELPDDLVAALEAARYDDPAE